MKRKEVEISERMRALTGLVTPGYVACDIGCDHGFVSIYLVQKAIAHKVIAADVRSGPLSHAKEHIRQYGLENRIETRLSDGLTKLSAGEAEVMICAGMGGPLMIKILEEGRTQARAMKELILQPQSEIEEFRRYLRTHGYHIIKENMVFEEGKFYPMMKVMPCTASVEGEHKNMLIEDRFGPYLLEHRHPVLKQFLEHSLGMTEELINELNEQHGERALARVELLKEELKLIREALSYFENEMPGI